MKRVISVLLALVICLSLPSVLPVKAAEGWLSYEIKDGEATVTRCQPSASGSLVIPAALGGCPVTAIGKSAFFQCILLSSITLPESVRSIGDKAFYSCSQLKTIYFYGDAPEFVTSCDMCYNHTDDPWGDLDFDFSAEHEFGPFEGISATAYYFGSASGWDAVTSEAMTGKGCGYTSPVGTITLTKLPATTLGGLVTAYGEGAVSLTLTSDKAYPCTLTVKENDYSIGGLLPGSYTLTVAQAEAVTHSYPFTVQEGENTLDLKLHQPGDINGDGRHDVSDMARMYAHVKSTKVLTDYAFLCADFTGDGKITVGDAAKVYGIIQGK